MCNRYLFSTSTVQAVPQLAYLNFSMDHDSPTGLTRVLTLDNNYSVDYQLLQVALASSKTCVEKQMKDAS